MAERVSYLGLDNCYRIANGSVELIVATDVGPRVLRYAFLGKENLLGEYPELSQTTEWGEWKPWGGHRMWIAPESLPRSYEPDSHPVRYQFEGDFAVRLTGGVELHTGVQKEMRIELASEGSSVQILHMITNCSDEPIELAVWALTIMTPGGVAIVPNEPFHPFPEILPPVRPMSLWSYTNLSDPRFEFSQDFVRLRSDASSAQPQKFGVGNTRQWCAYQCHSGLFVKHFYYEQNATYPDFGCNNEVYTAGGFIEIESLSPVRHLEPGQAARHEEAWQLISKVDDDVKLNAALHRL